jgi:scyllo-inositol 2-dehydrogenase (NADP+)
VKRYKTAEAIKCGVIGYGGAFNMGRHHLNEMKKAGMTPTAVAEIDPERLKVATQDFPGIETYSTVAEMLRKSGVQVLAIITPHNTHAKLALQCLKAKRHVVCEKPLAITTEECDAMIAAAKKAGVVLSTYHNRHWDGCILEAVKRIRAGAIGEIVRIEAHMGGWGQPRDWWRTSKKISGGILYDWGVHLLEYTLQLMDAKVAEVTGFSKTGFWADKTPWKKDTNEDEGFAVVRFANGAWSTLTISAIESKPKQGWLEITGTKGTYVFDGGTFEVITHAKGGETVVTKGANPPSEGWKLYQNIADHLVKGEALVITPEWARRPIHILDLAGMSAKKGTTLKARYS